MMIETYLDFFFQSSTGLGYFNTYKCAYDPQLYRHTWCVIENQISRLAAKTLTFKLHVPCVLISVARELTCSWLVSIKNIFHLSGDQDTSRNLRPQSREISLEEEKAEVLAEMRKVSESSDEWMQVHIVLRSL